MRFLCSLTQLGTYTVAVPNGYSVTYSYTYDGNGNILSISDGTNTTSYVYDTETNLYYLQSRYYDPAIGRFLSRDSFVSTGQGFVGNNMFAYCGNNPVVRVDHGGLFWESVFDVVTLGVSIVEVCISPADPLAWAGLVGDAVDLIPFVTGAGEIIRTVKTTSKVVDSTETVVDAAKAVYKSASATSDIRKATGTYEIIYKSGKNYIGKGGFRRALQSAVRNATAHGDEVTSIMWKSAPNDSAAFFEEYMMQVRFGGVLSSNPDLPTYNKIWSPGRRYLGD